MSDPRSFILPTADGSAVELPRETYEALIDEGGLSKNSFALITSAAQLLEQAATSEPRTFRQILLPIHGEAVAFPSTTEKRAMLALIKAKLIHKDGGMKNAVYRLAGGIAS